MAKKKQTISYLPAGFEREQSRRQGNRPKRRNILIVCEGEKTEPNYFESATSDNKKLSEVHPFERHRL